MFIIRMYFISLAPSECQALPVRLLGPKRDPGDQAMPTCLLLGSLKHPADPEFVVQCSIHAKEYFFQRVGDLCSFGQPFEKNPQLLECPSAQIEANRVSTDRRLFR